MKLASVLVACAIAMTAAQQQPVFRGGLDAVRVFVTVIDKDGRIVTNLAQENFEVRDEGKPQPITQFDNSPQPVQLVVMLDVSGSMEGNLELLRYATGQLVTRLGKGDVARIGSFGREVTISPAFTSDPRELAAATPTFIEPDAPTPLWRALDEAMGAFNKEDDRRKVVLVLSDGKDTGMMNLRQRPGSQADVIDRARRDDVMIYAVGMRSRGSQRAAPGMGPGGLRDMMLADMPDPGLARVAEESGGGYLEIRYGDDLGPAFASVVDELHTQYLLAFAPPKRDGKTHDISVKVNQGGMKARSRKSYVAPKS
ncbi:MAG TPA: VWA domain-containing protein [Vicinamibacterales bacterium]